MLYDSYVSSGQASGADVLAGDENASISKSTYHTKLVQKHMPIDRDVEILDIGCGNGGLLRCLKEHGYHACRGVDVSAEQVALAHRSGLNDVHQGDVFDFLKSLDAHSLDVVFAIDLLEHFAREELFGLLAEIHRVLAPGGRLIGHVPNAEGIYGARIRYGDMTHELAFTPNSVSQALRAVGFENVYVFEDVPHIHGVKSFVRRVLWHVGTLHARVLLAAETGNTRFVLSQNLLFIGETERDS